MNALTPIPTIQAARRDEPEVTIYQIVTATDPRVITAAFISRPGLVWSLAGAEQGHEKAVAEMVRLRGPVVPIGTGKLAAMGAELAADPFWRRLRHQTLRRARREVHKARAALVEFDRMRDEQMERKL